MEELKLFLEQHPHLQSFQDRLENEINSVPEQYRIMVLSKYILCNLEELYTELILLRLKISELSA